jgi:hypothetical protein
MTKRIGIAVAIVALSSGAHAAIALYGSDTFDHATGLWTYDYVIQGNGPETTYDFGIMVGDAALGTYNGLQPIPPAYTAPNGWTMFGSFSGSICPQYGECGGFYEWYTPGAGVQSATGFSVTTRFAPTDDGGANNYFLYGWNGLAYAVEAVGNLVVPDGADWLPMPAPAPELGSGLPSALAIGGVLLCWKLLRRARVSALPELP